MEVKSFDWYASRLDLARWENENAGQRSGFFGCPVHGGSDSLHVTEKNGKALMKCFACDASVFEITEALESQPEADEEPSEPVRIVRRGRRASPGGAQGTPAGNVGSTPTASTTSPLDWMAERCGLTRKQLDDLGLPLAEEGGFVVFQFPGVNGAKLRGIGEGKKGKSYQWRGLSNPPFWPMPDGSTDDVVICEGEADAICLRASGIAAHSITKGSSEEIAVSVWESLKGAGVSTVRLLFDMDNAGRKGRERAAEGARTAGLSVLEVRVVGIDALAGEKDARDVVLRQGYPLSLEHDADEEAPRLLADIAPIEPAKPLLGILHPQEHTILYGDGGTGKGVIASWWVSQLTKQDLNVLVVDYEYHANYEWRPRVEGFGGDMRRVAIIQPSRAIWDIQGWLAGHARQYDYVVIDSVTYACLGEEVEKSVTATKYSMAVNMLAVPVLSIAHVTKQNADPQHPFGSIFWSNGARVTVGVSRKDPEDPESVRVIRNVKTNQRGPFQTFGYAWDWLGNPGAPGCDGGAGCPDQTRHAHRKLHVVGVYRTKAECVRGLAQQFGRQPTEQECEDAFGEPFTSADIANAFRGKHAVEKPITVRRAGNGRTS
jgi:hypothetical protein